MMASGVNKALKLIKSLPRVSLANLQALPGSRHKHKIKQGQHKGGKCGRGNKGQGQRNTLPRVGFEGGNTPFYLSIPKEPYYEGHHMKCQYSPLSLLSIQRLVDLGRVDPERPIDLTTLCNTQAVIVDPSKNNYGISLTDEGADVFKARVSIEVQWASEQAIAAVERAGGVITTRFYDLMCISAMVDPELHFKKGFVIPRCKLPPQDTIMYYTDPVNRGYLADPSAVMQARLVLAQKYGYRLPEVVHGNWLYTMLMKRKDPRQIWFGLEPGWVVNAAEKSILKPSDEHLEVYYRS
jgi:large subunit ribosomal protein L15